MLNRLRWQLTILYIIAALGLVVFLGGGSYALLNLYFSQTTDGALQYKMATLFKVYGEPLPSELVRAERNWLDNNARSFLTGLAAATAVPQSSEGEEGSETGSDDELVEAHHAEEAAENEILDGSVAAIFVLNYDAHGVQILAPGQLPVPTFLDKSMVSIAIQEGHAWHTIRLEDGTRARLLFYHINSESSPTVILTGRLLRDQDRILRQYLTGLFLLACFVSLMTGLVSWWLSGRSILPAQSAWDQQQAFVANAGHELRTPLTFIRATAEFGLRGKPEPVVEKAFGDIIKESDYMGRLVEDLLLLSRLDTQRLKLRKEQINLPELLAETGEQIARLASDKGVSIILDNTEGQIWGDRMRVRQVLLILLDNALRFTPTGGAIHIRAHPQGKDVRVSIVDNGSGIPTEHQAHVFDRFYQVNAPMNEDNRGNGLGLSIAKALVEAQGGQIQLESILGKGTQVTVSLPAA